jgi:excisionase family DNA binding protein
MEQELLPIGQVAELLGVSIDTLRRWDDSGRFRPTTQSPGGHRLYSRRDVEIYLSDLFKLARDWVFNGVEPPLMYYCSNSAVFQSRLIKMQEKLRTVEDGDIKNIFSLVVAVAGEIGNNSFDHNLGNWPDTPGIFFGYDINKREVVLADRGQGVLKTLKRVRSSLTTDKDALEVAFTEIISGRSPEERGNGLKFVKNVVVDSLKKLLFQSGDAELKLEKGDDKLYINTPVQSFHGCIALINF